MVARIASPPPNKRLHRRRRSHVGRCLQCRRAGPVNLSVMRHEEPEMRKQYHFRPSERGVLVWDVDRLVELTKDFPRIQVPVSAIRELDEAYWFGGEDDNPTCRVVAEHARLIQETDLSYPIILSADGRVMDGMHRVAQAYIKGSEAIEAVQFAVDPEPDFVDVDPDSLPYEDAT